MHSSHFECVRCGCVWLGLSAPDRRKNISESDLFLSKGRCPECGHWNRFVDNEPPEKEREESE